MNKLLLAAFSLVATMGVALADATEIKLKDFKVKPKDGDTSELVGLNEDEGKIFMYVVATATAEIEAKDDGSYKFNFEFSGDMGNKDRAKFKLTIGGEVIEKSYELKQNESKEYTFKADVKKGKVKIEIEFLNDEFKEGEYDTNFYIHNVTYEAGKK